MKKLLSATREEAVRLRTVPFTYFLMPAKAGFPVSSLPYSYWVYDIFVTLKLCLGY